MRPIDLRRGCRLVAVALGTTLGATALAQPSAPAPSLNETVTEVDRQLDEADRLMLQGAHHEAKARLAEARQRLDALAQASGGQLPKGNVPLFVAEERLAAIQRQVDTMTPPAGAPAR
jgi:hypothetical protein